MTNPFDSIENRLSNIETLLLDIKHAPKDTSIQKGADIWFDLNDLCNYLPDKPSKPTVYGWVRDGLIPVNKGAKRLRFLKSEIDLWLKAGRRKTLAELSVEAEQYIKSKGGKL